MVSASPSRQNAQTLVDLDGRANGQYYVKIDNQGYVAGFGLFSTARNGPPVSEFYVRADRFAIGSPGVTRVQNEDGTRPPAPQDEIPFIVFTTPTIIEGKTVQPGVYMSRAFIHDGAIRNAMIGTAAINTLEIAGNAVTVPVAANQGGILTTSTSFQTVVSASVTYEAGAVPSVTYIAATLNVLVTDPGGGSTGFVSIVVNGSTIATFGTVAATGSSYAPAVSQSRVERRHGRRHAYRGNHVQDINRSGYRMERAEQHNVLSGRETMSEEFTVYDTRTGAILRTGLCPQGQELPPGNQGMGTIATGHMAA